MSGERCEKCRFSFTLVDALICRRYPPTVLAIEWDGTRYECEGAQKLVLETRPQDIQAYYPEVCVDDWCGEFAPQPSVPAADVVEAT